MRLKRISEEQLKQPCTSMERNNIGSQYNATDFNHITSEPPKVPVSNPKEKQHQKQLEKILRANKQIKSRNRLRS